MFIAEKIKEAFFEGYASYETPANAYNSAQSAWEESEAKTVYDELYGTIAKKEVKL